MAALQNAYDRIYCRLTAHGGALYQVPFSQLLLQTHYNPAVHQAVVRCTGLPLEEVSRTLTSETCIRRYVMWYSETILDAYIILDEEAGEALYRHADLSPDSRSYQRALDLTLLHDRPRYWSLLQPLPTAAVLQQLYRRGAQGCLVLIEGDPRWSGIPPDVGTLRAAVRGGLEETVGELLRAVTPTPDLAELTLARDRPSLWPALRTPDSTPSLEEWHHLCRLGEWDRIRVLGRPPEETWYSALLSGDLRVVRHLEAHYPQLHHNLQMDAPQSPSGRDSLLLGDCTYTVPGQEGGLRFSHSVNYAIQSGSLATVVYVRQRGYGITLSNLVTAYRQSTWPILRYLLSVYRPGRQLPSYLWMLWGPDSYAPQAEAKIRLLAPRLQTEVPRRSRAYQRLSVYRELCRGEGAAEEDPLWMVDLASLLPGGPGAPRSSTTDLYWAQCRAALLLGSEPPPPRGEIQVQVRWWAEVWEGQRPTMGTCPEEHRYLVLGWGRRDLVPFRAEEAPLWSQAGLLQDPGPEVLWSRHADQIARYLRAHPEVFTQMPLDLARPLVEHLYLLASPEVVQALQLPETLAEQVADWMVHYYLV